MSIGDCGEISEEEVNKIKEVEAAYHVPGTPMPPSPSGIKELESTKVKEFCSKAIEKVVRVSCKDGRVYVCQIGCVDKTKTVFCYDALEIIDTKSEHFVSAELITPFIMNLNDQHYRLRMMGNAVIPCKEISSIKLDPTMQVLYEQHALQRSNQIAEYEELMN